jgi:hypothetical protein
MLIKKVWYLAAGTAVYGIPNKYTGYVRHIHRRSVHWYILSKNIKEINKIILIYKPNSS